MPAAKSVEKTKKMERETRLSDLSGKLEALLNLRTAENLRYWKSIDEQIEALQAAIMRER